MVARNDSFREKLLSVELPSDQRLESHQRAVESRLDRFLSRTRPIRYALIGLAGGIGALICGSLVLTEPESLRPEIRGFLAVLTLIGLGWSVFAGRAVARGEGNFENQRAVASRMAMVATLLTVLALAGVASVSRHPQSGLPLVLAGLAMFVLASVRFLFGEIERSRSATREHLLRIESRLVDLSNALAHSTAE